MWTVAGDPILIGTISGPGTGDVLGVSNGGKVCAGHSVSSNNPINQGFRWTEATGMEALGTLPGDSSSTAVAITPDSQYIVGSSAAQFSSQPFRYTTQGGMQGLGNIPGYVYGEAHGVSADGQTVVGYCVNAANNSYRAFKWTPQGGSQSFLPTFAYSFAQDVSADGSVIVGRFGTQAFHWSQAGGLITLPVDSTATAVTADGSVMVGDTSTGPFIWDQVNGMRTLTSYFKNEVHLDLNGFNPVKVTDISADGSVIVGFGDLPGGARHGFVAVVPLPPTLVLIAFGGIGTRRRRCIVQ